MMLTTESEINIRATLGLDNGFKIYAQLICTSKDFDRDLHALKLLVWDLEVSTYHRKLAPKSAICSLLFEQQAKSLDEAIRLVSDKLSTYIVINPCFSNFKINKIVEAL